MLTILHPLDLVIPGGRVVAVTGASGSGKSTLLGLIAGLDAPSTGTIVVDDVDITALGEDALARLRGTRIGFVFQFFHLLPSLTAFENILVPIEIASDAITGAATHLIHAAFGDSLLAGWLTDTATNIVLTPFYAVAAVLLAIALIADRDGSSPRLHSSPPGR